MTKKKKLKYIGDDERIIPNHGQFKPGDEVDYNETLLSTGLFVEINEKKAGEK